MNPITDPITGGRAITSRICSWTGARTGHDVARLEPGPVVALPVGDHSPGLPHQQAAGGHVPGAEAPARSSRRAPRPRSRRGRGWPHRPGGGPRRSASARSNTGKYSGSRSRLARNGNPVAQIASSGSRSLIADRLVVAGGAAPEASGVDADRASARGPRRRPGCRRRPARPTRRPRGSRARSSRCRRAGRRTSRRRRAIAAGLLAEERELGGGVVQERRGSRARSTCRRRSPSRPDPSCGRCSRHRTRRARSRRRPRPRAGPRRAARRDRGRRSPSRSLRAARSSSSLRARGDELPTRGRRRARRDRARRRRRPARPLPGTRAAPPR